MTQKRVGKCPNCGQYTNPREIEYLGGLKYRCNKCDESKISNKKQKHE